MHPAIITINDLIRKVDTHCKVTEPEQSLHLIDDIFKAMTLYHHSDMQLTEKVSTLEEIWHRWNHQGTVNKGELSLLVGESVQSIDKYVKGGYGVFLKRSTGKNHNVPVYFSKLHWEDFKTHLLSVTQG